MAIYYNPNTYDIGANAPIDSRYTKGTNVLRDAIPPAVRYEGLTVYVADPTGDGLTPGTVYILKGGIANGNWASTSSLGALWQDVLGVTTNIGAGDVRITSKLVVPIIRPNTDSTTAIQITKANGTSPILTVDSTNNRIGIGTSSPGQMLSVYDGRVNITSTSTTDYSVLEFGNSGSALVGGFFAGGVSAPGYGGPNSINLVNLLAYPIAFGTNNVIDWRILSGGNFGNVTTPTAGLHLKAGSTVAGSGPLKLTSGALMTTSEVGAIEFLTDAYYGTITTGAARKQFAFRETTLSGYGITDGLRNDTTGSISGGLTVTSLTVENTVPNLITLKHNYTTTPSGNVLLNFVDESDVSQGSIGLVGAAKALTLTSSASSPLISLASPTRADSGIQYVDATTTITRDSSNNLVFTDAVSGSKTLAQLLAGHVWTVTSNDIYSNNTGNVGIGSAPTTGYKLDVAGALRLTGKILSAQSGSDSLEIESKSSSGYDFRVYNVTKAAERLYINSSGYVGINTNAHTDQFAVVSTTTGIYAGNLQNTHASGKGLRVAGASGTNEALYVGDYQGSSLFEVLGTGTTKAKRIQLDAAATPATIAEGLMQWDSTAGTLAIGMKGGNATLQVGQEMFLRVLNITGSPLADGQLVYISGNVGGVPTVALAKSDSVSTSIVVGMVTEPIAHNAQGFITTVGFVHDIKTDYPTFTVGQMLWVSATTAGAFTNVQPVTPHHSDRIGLLSVVHATTGSVLISIDRHTDLTDLADVDGTPLTTDGQMLSWHQTQGYWGADKNINNYTTLTQSKQFAIDINRFGFLNRSETTLAFDGVNTLTLGSVGATWSYYRSGIKYTITGSKTKVLATPMVDGKLYYVYIDSTDGTLISDTGGWTLNDTKVPVATVYWDNTLTPKYVKCDERHTVAIDRAYHREHHFADGTELVSPGIVTGLVALSTTPANKTFGISGTQIFDEDLCLNMQALVDPDGATPTYYILYRTSATTYKWVLSDMPFKYTGAAAPFGFIEYDLAGTSTAMSTDNRFCNTYIFTSNSVSPGEANPEISTAGTRYFIMQGRAIYSSQALAEAEQFLVSAGMPVAEGVALYRLCWRNNGINNTVKGRCEFVSITQVNTNLISSGSISTTTHNLLTGLDGGTPGVEAYHMTLTQWEKATQNADATHDGILVQADWSTFNNKSGNAYTNAVATPATIGGIPAGSTFSNKTIYQMFDDLLYPYQVPVFSSFAISGQSQTLECGVSITGGAKTFTWGTTNSTNVGANTIVISDITGSSVLGSSLANDGTESLDIGAAITKLTTATINRWAITGTTTQPIAMAAKTFDVTWHSPFYYGVGAAALSVSQVQGLTKAVVGKSNYTRTFSPSSQKFYYAYPASHGDLVSIIDPNGFNITTDFTKTTVNFTTNSPSYEGGTVSYNVYESNSLTTQTSFNITFNF